MYRVFFYLALLAFTSAAPLDGWNGASSAPSTSFQSQQSFVQQTSPLSRNFQRDENEIVDTLGAGYSFFQKQPIGSRPLSQQKAALNDQFTISSLDDNANQWSGYTKASALNTQVPVIRNAPSSYGQQEQGYAAPQAPLAPRAVSGGYGQQETQVIVPQAPMIRVADNQYGQQQQQQQFDQSLLTVKSNNGGYGQQESQVFVPQASPMIRTAGNQYGQQEIETVVPQRPVIRTTGSQYGQQELPMPVPQAPAMIRSAGNQYGQQEIETVVPQRPLIRTVDSQYGQQQQQQQQFDQSLLTSKSNNGGYGQQEIETVVPQRPLIRTTGSQYDQQELPIPVPQTMIRVTGNQYGQQPQQQQFDQTLSTIKSDNGYGQQQAELPRNLGMIPSNRFISQPRAFTQMSNSGTTGNW
jgi:hypothetical protein